MILLLTRRSLLRIGASSAGLAMGCLLGMARRVGGTPAGARINAWIRIGGDDTITVRVAHTEMGQGIHTLAAMLVAEELEVDPSKLRIEVAHVAPEYWSPQIKEMVPGSSEPEARNPQIMDMITGGSDSVISSFAPLRLAGAHARMMLLAAAAQHWHCRSEDCVASDGRVRNRRSGAILSYGALAVATARLAPPREAKLKPPSAWRLLGQPMRRLEGPDKVRGTASFGIDIRVPDMLIAAVRNCPVAGGKLRSVDPAAAMQVPGVVKVVPLEDAVIVVAGSFWAALQGIEALQVEWEERENAQLDSTQISERLDTALAADGLVATERGAEPSAGIETRLALRFEVPPLAHAALEPVCATVAIGRDGVDVWAPTQVQTMARKVVAAQLGTRLEQVRIHTPLAGGSFGRKLQVDYVRQAAIAAKAVGRPVKLIWPRSEELQHDFYRPPAATALELGLDANGLPVSWTQRLAVPDMRRFLAEFDTKTTKSESIDPFAVEGATSLPYAIPHHRLTWHDVPLSLPIGWWRSVGHSFNAWFIEHAIDIIAHERGQDPVAFRLMLLKDQPRHQAVLRALSPLWSDPPAPGHFRGTAVHASYGSVVAQSVEISLKGSTVRVHRVACAIDCGTALNPDGVRAQMEGGIIFGLTAALYGEITLQNGRVQQQNLDSYRLLALREAPEIEVAIVGGSAPLGGVGEAGVPPVAPALCNAVLAATGEPVKRLPIRLTV
jgi:isoquinoline 1-oxidoreductase subunit beta